jgi:hypothetical protein
MKYNNTDKLSHVSCSFSFKLIVSNVLTQKSCVYVQQLLSGLGESTDTQLSYALLKEQTHKHSLLLKPYK